MTTAPSDTQQPGVARPKAQRSAITFEGGLDAPFHRWFRLTPSFSPDLVRGWMEANDVSSGKVLFEPFAGAGTTNIVCKELGVESVGVEINPFLAFVGQTSLDWTPTGDALREAALSSFRAARLLVEEGSANPGEFADNLGIEVPRIHNVSRWWRDEVLCELMALRYTIALCETGVKDHLRLALAQIVYSTANITLGRLQVAFVDRSSQVIPVFAPFLERIEAMADDLDLARTLGNAKAEIVRGDSLAPDFLADATVDAVFTSPPYPNRYSYVWNTRPHLYLLEFFSTPGEAAELDMKTIGGTWGGATTSLQRGVVEPTGAVCGAAGEVIERLHAESTLMGNYVTKYFNALDAQIGALRPKMRDGGRVGYVVGNSESKGIMVETHEILGELFMANGFDSVTHEVLRKRNSGQGLVEVTVGARAAS